MEHYLGIGVAFPISCLTAAILAITPTTILTNERPVHLAVLTLLCVNAIIWLITKRTTAQPYNHNKRRPKNATSILGSGHIAAYKPLEKQTLQEVRPSRLLQYAWCCAAAVAIVFRIDNERRVLLTSECATIGVEVWLPFLIAIYDALRWQRRESHEPDAIVNDQSINTGEHPSYLKLTRTYVLSRSINLPVLLTFSFGCFLISGLWLSTTSTQICPLINSEGSTVSKLQWLSLFLDAFLLIAATELAAGGQSWSRLSSSITAFWTLPILLAIFTWASIGAVLGYTQPENHKWIWLLDEPSPILVIFTMCCQALFLSALCVSCLYSILDIGVLHLVTVLTGIWTVIPGLRFLTSAKRPYPPVSSLNLTWSFILVYVAWAFYARIRTGSHTSTTSPSVFRKVLLTVVFVVFLFPGLMKTNTVHYHPIDLLMYEAQKTHLDYLKTAASSQNLAEAVKSYKTRYADNPPPKFDVWFEFAKKSSVWITDEFDQIYNDLLPFRVIPPKELRDQTWSLVSNPWNEVSGISVRQGKAELQKNVLPTHRWMLEGVVRIMKSFSEHLPDMDIAFNLNDESRISLKHDFRLALEAEARKSVFRLAGKFSTDRAPGWKEILEDPTTETDFENWSFRNCYQEWAAKTCSKSSAARRDTKPRFKSQFCIDCAAKHSLGQFIANWSIAADPCHQPDLANLHGFYLSPAAFKSSHKLLPVFSQSKAPGFSDILYPSAWNYIDKVAYAPTNTSKDNTPAFPDLPFGQKVDSLYWRGATSEGVSAGLGAWRGMTRQRMVHMANNLTNSPHDVVTLLLPDQRRAGKYTYTTLPGSTLPNLGLHTDVHFVEGIARCGGRDCDDQATEFGLSKSENFQHHWTFKYLIDLDGAGFSGRFLSFLQSHCLPLKAALFREWHDSRLVPWLHFVPLDLRLHGLYSTLAYFTGVRGIDAHGRRWDWAGHQREAEFIAEQGREWSQKVLRKEDMEVYFFRLLLEWARLTDDRRDELGFVMKE